MDLVAKSNQLCFAGLAGRLEFAALGAVVRAEVAVLAHALRVVLAAKMLAVRRKTWPPDLVVAVIAHALGEVLAVVVWAVRHCAHQALFASTLL